MKTCFDCKELFVPQGRNQKYCGSRTLKIGCSFKHKDDFRNVRSPSFRAVFFPLLVQKHGATCRKCGVSSYLEINHIIPKVIGGKNNLNNLELLCPTCNKSEYYNLVKVALLFYFKYKKADTAR